MITVKDVVKRALRLLSITQAGESPSAPEFTDTLSALNSMLFGWQLDAIRLEHVELYSDDVLPYEESHEEPIIYNLATRIAPEFGVAVSREVGVVAARGFANLQNYYDDPDLLITQPALDPSLMWNRNS